MSRPKSKPKRTINLSVLPGEPTDGSGRVCIHLFVQDEQGAYVEPHVLHPGTIGQLVAKPTRGRLACDPKRIATPKDIGNNVTAVTFRTDEPRAVNCPKCMATEDYKEKMARFTTGE